MLKKSFAVFGLLSLLALGTISIAVSPAGYVSDIFAQDVEIINYTQKFDHLDEKEGQLGLTTKNGNFIKVNAPSKSVDGLVELNNYQEFSLVTPIGGIISMSLEMSVNGKAYPGDGLTCPYMLEFAYFIDTANPSKGYTWIEAPEGYQNEYIWGLGREFETPSFLKLTSLEDNLLIKSMTLTYNCSHIAADDAIDQNATYLLLENQEFPGVCANGLKGVRNGDEIAFYIDLYANDKFYFQKPHGEKLAINLANDGDPTSNAILNGYASYDEVSHTFTVIQDIELGIFIKDSGVTYVTYNKLIEQDWYVTGENLTFDDTLVPSCWGETSIDAMMDQVESWQFTYQPFIAQGGDNPTLLKLMSGDKQTYLGFDNFDIDINVGTVEKDKDGNIKFLKSGVFRIDLYLELQFAPYFVINPYVG